jgi:hypothetical protein
MFPPLARLVARLSALLGLYAVYFYATSGLALSHYDAKAHLVVARRIIDSITPGWEQIGAVWLPLPHLLNMLPVQIDHLYRTGGFAIAISVLSQAVGVAAITATVLQLTASPAGAILAATLFATNPNVLYLQSTPMTEPMLFGLTALQICLLTHWIMNGSIDDRRRSIGWVTVMACLTRYEAWPITGCAFAASTYAWWRRGAPFLKILRAHAWLALYPLMTVAGFMLLSRITVNEWFVSGGFFVPDETLQGDLSAGYEKIVEGATLLAGSRLVRIAQVSVVVVVVLSLWRRERAPMMVPLALFGAVALPVTAYYAGHPFRMRYEIPIILAASVAIGLAIGQLRGWAKPAAALVFLLVYLQRPPFDPRAPITTAARSWCAGARSVTTCTNSRWWDSTSRTSCTKEMARSGTARLRAGRRRWQSGC